MAERTVRLRDDDEGRRETGSAAKAGRAEPAQRRDEREDEKRQRSDVDAMGEDKHRKVVEKRYGLSTTRRLVYYGIFGSWHGARLSGVERSR
jgi:hypothetical protein